MFHSDIPAQFNQYCSMCFQGNQFSWYFCGSCKKRPRNDPQKLESIHNSTSYWRLLFSSWLCHYARLRGLKSNWWWHKLLCSIAKCSLLGGVDAVIRSMIRYDFSLSFTWSISVHFLGISIKQFDAKGRRQKQIPHRPFLGIHDQLVVSVILFFRFSLRFFVVLIRSLKQAVFFWRPESLR